MASDNSSAVDALFWEGLLATFVGRLDSPAADQFQIPAVQDDFGLANDDDDDELCERAGRSVAREVDSASVKPS